ncbi:MAG: sensor histidine kinase [Erysipelotrichaceae bacterium]
MKLNNFTLKKQLLLYLLGFTILIVVFLWLFQVFIFPNIYKIIKKNDIITANEKISAIATNYDAQQISDVANRYNVCAVVIYLDNTSQSFKVSHNPQICFLNDVDSTQMNYFYKKALNSSEGIYLERIGLDQVIDNRGDAAFLRKDFSAIVYSTLSLDGKLLVITNADTVMQTSTQNSLNIILVVSSLTLLLVAILLSYFISRKVSSPILLLSKDVKKIGTGNYDIIFDYRNNKEMSDLTNSLNHTVKKLAEVDQLRKELIANVSHDLKTPLTLISSYGELMKDYPKEINSENIDIIINEANYLNELVNDILDLSKYENHLQKLNLTDFNIKALIKDLINLNKISTKSIELKLSRNALVRADEIKIRQVLTNLITNALEYADSKIIIKTQVVDQRMLIAIIDDGAGIDQQNQEKIWDRYYRSTDKSSYHSGIGLSIVKKICELHQIEYGVDSALNQGSTFYFYLELSSKD